MRPRGLSNKFLRTMRNKLERDRQRGYDDWDNNFRDWWVRDGINSELLKCLSEEVFELAVAMERKNKRDIVNEAADVANFAMFIANYHGDL